MRKLLFMLGLVGAVVTGNVGVAFADDIVRADDQAFAGSDAVDAALARTVLCRRGGPGASEAEYLREFQYCRIQVCPSFCTAGGRVDGQLYTNGFYNINCVCN